MGAWIETSTLDSDSDDDVSHPEWVRGLKPYGGGTYWGRWQSHPEWVRGLKLKVAEQFGSFSKSHPEWVRGLKHSCVLLGDYRITSHPEWVRGLKLITEIIIIRTIRRTPSGCVDWNQLVSKCKIEHCGYCYTWAELSIFLVPIGALWWYRFADTVKDIGKISLFFFI